MTYTYDLPQNVQYLILALFWLTSKPVARKFLVLAVATNNNPCSLYSNQVSLFPYTIFSLFHALTFTRTTLMPQILPPGPPATAGGAPTPHPLSKKLQVWVRGMFSAVRSMDSPLTQPSQLRLGDEGSGVC